MGEKRWASQNGWAIEMEALFPVIVFITGLLMGSFFNVCIYRIPKKESIVFPASHCTVCNAKLNGPDLIPVLSYLCLRGRCRYCHAKISVRYPLIELLTGSVYLALAVRVGMGKTFVAYAVLCSLLIVAAAIDMEYQIIPDGLIRTGGIFGILLSLAGWSVSWQNSLAGMLLGGGFPLLVAFLFWKVRHKEGMGGGDGKLMGLVGLFLGWKQTALSILLSIYAGGLFGGILLLLHKKKYSDAIPFAPFIAIGTFLSILYGRDLIRWYLQIFFGRYPG